MGETAIKISLITLIKVVIGNLFLGKLGAAVQSFLESPEMKERMGESKTDVPDTAGISDKLTPKIILLCKN